MDGKEKITETVFAALVALVSGWFVKKGVRASKPFWSWVKNLWGINKIETIKADLKSMKDFQDAIIEIHRSPIYYTDQDGGVIYVNTAWVELTGFTNAEDAHGLGYMRAVSDEDEQDIMAINQSYYKHPTDLEGIVTFVNLRTKIPVTCKYRSRVIKDAAGKFIIGVGILEVIKP